MFRLMRKRFIYMFSLNLDGESSDTDARVQNNNFTEPLRVRQHVTYRSKDRSYQHSHPRSENNCWYVIKR